MAKNSKSNVAGEVKISQDIAKELQKDLDNLPSLQKRLENILGGSVSQLLEVILAGAVFTGGSDIHIEPEEERAKIRVRLDGILHDVISLDKKDYQQLLSRIKLLSQVKLNIEDRPQDGRFSIIIELPKDSIFIEIRMSSLPSEYGETIVMRILDPRKLIALSELGLRKGLLETFEKEIKKPNGMIIVTGPTGSGKTTTLYAFLKTINKPGTKIITIENPVEYHLEGISQTETKPDRGYDFANGLRAIVRQDPDVILVGEIRDLETAQISMQAALTGHLVFSTLHTNDAPGAVARLHALGEKPVNIAPAINMVIAQRLVRKVCKRCVKIKEAEEEVIEKIKEELKGIQEDYFSIEPPVKLAQAVGCKECSHTGYKGRIGIFETFLMDDDLRELLFRSPSTTEIRRKAIEKGMITVRQDGLTKVLNQETTLEEVDRIT